MNRSIIDRITNAALYEGYILYPYRPAVKNRQRWTFGGLFPEMYCMAEHGSELAEARTECLVRGSRESSVELSARFLHLTHRQVIRSGTGEPVESLRIGKRTYHTWQEAEEREVATGSLRIAALLEAPHEFAYSFPDKRWLETIRAEDGTTPGQLQREQQSLDAVLTATATETGAGHFRLSVVLRNRTSLKIPASRDDALLRSLVSAHIVLAVRDGQFLSQIDPPESFREAASQCRQNGLWPVLVGEEGRNDTMLASPIILYDYPQVAPESPGDLFDATEIDEILMLRILTLTDDEKEQMASVDDRARDMLARVQSLPESELANLHGAFRSLQAPTEEARG